MTNRCTLQLSALACPLRGGTDTGRVRKAQWLLGGTVSRVDGDQARRLRHLGHDTRISQFFGHVKADFLGQIEVNSNIARRVAGFLS